MPLPRFDAIAAIFRHIFTLPLMPFSPMPRRRCYATRFAACAMIHLPAAFQLRFAATPLMMPRFQPAAHADYFAAAFADAIADATLRYAIFAAAAFDAITLIFITPWLRHDAAIFRRRDIAFAFAILLPRRCRHYAFRCHTDRRHCRRCASCLLFAAMPLADAATRYFQR